MKKNIILCILASASLLATSCEDILDKEPTDKLSLEETFKDLDGVKTALSGAYSSLLALEYYQRNIMVYPDLAGGNIKYSKFKEQTLLDLYTYEQSANLSSANATYEAIYKTLNNVNNIIKYTPNTLYATEEQKNRVLAEAKAMRALLHFDLARMFARPYSHTSDASHPGIILNMAPRLYSDPLPTRATTAQTYEAIITDLSEALDLFSNSSAVFSGGNAKAYFNANVVKALLAKVYLYKSDWQHAYQYADEVINSNQYQLLSGEDFVNSWGNKATSAETIFELALKNDFSGTSLGNYYALSSTQQMYATTDDLLNLYTATDVRGAAFMFNSEDISGSTYYFTKKYAQGSTGSTNIKVLRLAEVYLIRAEAAAELGNLLQANEDLNKIIRRADAEATPASYTSRDNLIEAILLERRKELAFEGNLLFDLTRWKQAINRQDCFSPTCYLPYEDFRRVLPLPKETINVNPELLQNEGY